MDKILAKKKLKEGKSGSAAKEVNVLTEEQRVLLGLAAESNFVVESIPEQKTKKKLKSTTKEWEAENAPAEVAQQSGVAAALLEAEKEEKPKVASPVSSPTTEGPAKYVPGAAKFVVGVKKDITTPAPGAPGRYVPGALKASAATAQPTSTEEKPAAVSSPTTEGPAKYVPGALKTASAGAKYVPGSLKKQSN